MVVMYIKKLSYKIRDFLLTTNIQLLIATQILVGICFFGASMSDVTHQGLFASLGFICCGISGIPKIVRQESDYGILRLEGTFAVMDGIITILLSLGLTSIFIIVR
jgi:hypothetical protein